MNSIADEVAVLQSGVIVEHGAVGEVLQRPRHEYTQVLRAAAPELRTGVGSATVSDASLT